MNEREAKKLLEKYLSGQCSEEEKTIVEDWYNQLPAQSNEKWKKKDPDFKKAGKKLSHSLPLQNSRAIWYPIGVAASILALLCIGIFQYLSHGRQELVQQELVKNDIEPGSDKAVLILHDGRTIALGDSKEATLLDSGGIHVVEMEDGGISYRFTDISTKAVAPSAINRIQTPRGGQYHIVLADGTKVWLNASSSLKFPVSFAGDKRIVELEGEAYFEVSKNKQRPFHVKSIHQDVEVLGTHFNINAYRDESNEKTTLLEGKVRIKLTDSSKGGLLKPGQQASVSEEQMLVQEIDTEEVVAWKNGYFDFNNKTLELGLKEIARWYDVHIIFKNKTLKNLELAGTISKYAHVQQVLQKIALSGAMKFKIENRNIIIE